VGLVWVQVPQGLVLVQVQVQVLQEGGQVVVGKRKLRGQDHNILACYHSGNFVSTNLPRAGHLQPLIANASCSPPPFNNNTAFDNGNINSSLNNNNNNIDTDVTSNIDNTNNNNNNHNNFLDSNATFNNNTNNNNNNSTNTSNNNFDNSTTPFNTPNILSNLTPVKFLTSNKVNREDAEIECIC
jgi:hypothetical protein